MQDFILSKREDIAKLCRTHHVRRLSVFGSALREDFDPECSDIDIRVEFEQAAPTELTDSFALHDQLVQLFGREVDLLSRREIENPYLKRIIEESQVTMYAA